MVSRALIIFAAISAVLITRPIFGQTGWRGRCDTPVFLQLRSGLDSNPLRLAVTPSGTQEKNAAAAEPADPGGEGNADSGQSDALALLRPSLGVRCAATSKTTLSATYTLGVERYLSTSVLNTTAHQGEVRLHHASSSGWRGEVYGSLERSNQPDVLNTSARLSFANFTARQGGLRVFSRGVRGSSFAEYSLQARRYTRLTSDLSARQSDSLHMLTVGHWWTIAPESFLSLRLDYRQNQSNDPLFRYREPIASVTLGRLFGNGFRVEATPRLRRLTFASRPVSSDPARKRSDVIPGISIALRKDFTSGVAGIASYTFDKDFSTEPQRRFNDHRVFVGVDVRLGHRPGLFSQDRLAQPIEAVALANRGYEEIRRGNWSEALRLSLEALRIDADLPEAHTNAGVAYYKLGNEAAAIDEWKKSLALRQDAKVLNLLRKVAPAP